MLKLFFVVVAAVIAGNVILEWGKAIIEAIWRRSGSGMAAAEGQTERAEMLAIKKDDERRVLVQEIAKAVVMEQRLRDLRSESQ